MNPAGHQAQARFPGRAGQPCGSWDRALVTREIWRPHEHSAQARVAWRNWSTSWALGPAHESPGRACRPHGPSDRGRVARESLSTPQALEHGPRSAGTSGRAHRTSGVGPSLPGELVNNAGHRPERKLPGSAAGYRGPLEKSASRSGELFDLAGYWNMARENWDSWLTPWTIGPWRESLGTDGRPRAGLWK